MTVFKVQRSLFTTPEGTRWLIYNEEQDQLVEVDIADVPHQLIDLMGERLKMFVEGSLDSDEFVEVPDPGW